MVKNNRLEEVTYQKKVPPTTHCQDIARAAFELFCKNYPFAVPVRMIGITVSGFDHHVEQMSLFGMVDGDSREYDKRERAEQAIANIRGKYGYASLQRGIVMEDERINGLDVRGKKD